MATDEWDVSPETMAKLKASIVPAHSNIPLRDVLVADYPEVFSSLPIEGGWGGSRDEAVVFVRDQFTDPEAPAFVRLEYLIAEQIVDEELFMMRRDGPVFHDARLALQSQSLEEADGRRYDCLRFEVTCWSDQHVQGLRAFFESPASRPNSEFDEAAYSKLAAESKIRYTRSFWFDITDVYDDAFAKMIRDIQAG
jgi:hypothetical protein